jgi:hypothetical protein
MSVQPFYTLAKTKVLLINVPIIFTGIKYNIMMSNELSKFSVALIFILTCQSTDHTTNNEEKSALLNTWSVG